MRNVECGMQNEKGEDLGFHSEFRNPHSEFALPGGPASKLRNADCGMRIAKENQENPKSEIRNPK